MFLKISQYSQENICVRVSSGATLLEKTLAHVFSCEYCKLLGTPISKKICERLLLDTFRKRTKNKKLGLKNETCPYSEFFWSVFPRIQTEYGEIPQISPYSVRMRGNTDQKNSEYGHFSRTVKLEGIFIRKKNLIIAIYLKISKS